MNDPMHELSAIVDDVTGANDHSMWRGRPYDGQPHTHMGTRGKQEIRGLTMRDLRDCYLRAWCLSMGVDNPVQYSEANKGEMACISDSDIYALKGGFDHVAIFQNMVCEIERVMGIFPNIPNRGRHE